MIVFSDKYQKIGEEIIKELFPGLEDKPIVFVESSESKKGNDKIVFADCRVVNKYYKWCCPYDFMITVYNPNVVNLDDKQIRILLEHELLHCGYKSGVAYIVPHDIEDFYQIIKKYGIGWHGHEDLFDFDIDFDL